MSSQRLKRWESPRREGRNDKGRGGAARKRQLKKQTQMLRQRLKESDSAKNNSKQREEKSVLPSIFLALHNREIMQCPRCNSTHIVKTGRRKGKQNYLCHTCRRQFIDTYEPKGYSPEVKEHCLMLYVNGRF